MRTSVFVAPLGDVEVRRVTLVNESDRRRVLELTSYAEVALADPEEDRRHPAFSKLFVQGRYATRVGALMLERRTRGDERPLHLAHAVATSDADVRPVAWQLDREAFVGRGGSVRAPLGYKAGRIPAAADETWAPLDPIISLTTRVELPPGREVSVAFLTAVADTASSALTALDAYRSPDRALFAVDQARDRERALAFDLGLAGDVMPTFQRLLTALVFPYHDLRTAPPYDHRPIPSQQEQLWAGGISGDLPIALLETDGEGDPLLDEMVRAHAYWERHGAAFDLVVVGTPEDGYEQPLRGKLDRLLTELDIADRLQQRGGIHYLSFGRMSEPALVALRAAASIALVADGRTLAGHLTRLERAPPQTPSFVPVPSPEPTEPEIEGIPRSEGRLFDNGVGGFVEDGAGYTIHLEPGESTAAPWSNVLAHERFGCVVTESGGGYTWAENSGERRLTAWRNDPVTDTPSEAVYLRDEETSEVWSPTPGPAPAPSAYEVVHRAGLTEFRHRSHGLTQRVRMYTPPGELAKVIDVSLHNGWRRPRRLTATYYAEWVLGVHRWSTAPHLRTQASRPERALFAQNLFSPATAGVIAFLGSSETMHAFTCDRFEFVGPEGDFSRPVGLVRTGLEGRRGPFLDPCAALQVHVDLAAGESRTVRFMLGAAASIDEARRALTRLRDPTAALDEGAATHPWNEFLGRITVSTPEPSMDVLLNHWLPYQAVACRLWGRTGLYQSSGAIGFRDQLQDSLALRAQAPHLARHQILEAARHQFEEGDVLHWWHPDDDRGVRTRCSDDLLWLPFAVVEYLDATGDRGVLDEAVPFLEGALLEPGEAERFDRFGVGGSGSLYEHCIAAFERSSPRSPRGLPLIGSGDWNDALNRVGLEGRGESVWLAWFLYAVQTRFAAVSEQRGDRRMADLLRDDAERLRHSVEAHCWDGAWYQRATFDDGTPIGTSRSAEGTIDSLTQSWAVLSGGADPERQRIAMTSVFRHLVSREDRLVLLLTPPFQDAEPDPGYIRSYPPGVRENGGQYTHAAAWVGRACAKIGDGDLAEEVFRLINPVLRTADASAASAYRVEPYVLAGDVYGAPPHVGRGGWSWYTGSAGWVYRLGLEDILGLTPVPGGVEIRPCVPRSWPEYEMRIRVGVGTTYRIVVRNPEGVHSGVAAATLDGERLERPVVRFVDDGETHEVDVLLGGDVAVGEVPRAAIRSPW
jgi:cyclic beta-1,2-glucan synthetase